MYIDKDDLEYFMDGDKPSDNIVPSLNKWWNHAKKYNGSENDPSPSTMFEVLDLVEIDEETAIELIQKNKFAMNYIEQPTQNIITYHKLMEM